MQDIDELFKIFFLYKDELRGFTLSFSFILGTITFGPPGGNRIIPAPVKVSIALALSMPVFGIKYHGESGFEFIFYILTQFFYGALTGWAVSLIFYAFQSAGKIVDDLRGMAQVSLLDPFQSVYTSISGMFFFLIACLLFFYSGAYKILIVTIIKRATMFNYNFVPLNFIFNGAFTEFFNAIVMLSLPFVISFFLVEIAAGILNRSLPALNVYFLLHQSKIILGIFLVSAILNNTQNLKNFFMKYFLNILFLTKL